MAGTAVSLAITAFSMTDPRLLWLFWLSWAATSVFIFCNITVYGLHLWEPWWRGHPVPFEIDATVHAHDFSEGTVVGGIYSRQGFSHASIVISNAGVSAIEDIDALFITPTHRIAGSAAESPFADCKIAADRDPGPVTVMNYDAQGKLYVEPQPGPGFVRLIAPAHRLLVPNLPPRNHVSVSLAFVTPGGEGFTIAFNPFATDPKQPAVQTGMWDANRTDPDFVVVKMTWTQGGERHEKEWQIPLRKI